MKRQPTWNEVSTKKLKTIGINVCTIERILLIPILHSPPTEWQPVSEENVASE